MAKIRHVVHPIPLGDFKLNIEPGEWLQLQTQMLQLRMLQTFSEVENGPYGYGPNGELVKIVSAVAHYNTNAEKDAFQYGFMLGVKEACKRLCELIHPLAIDIQNSNVSVHFVNKGNAFGPYSNMSKEEIEAIRKSFNKKMHKMGLDDFKMPPMN